MTRANKTVIFPSRTLVLKNLLLVLIAALFISISGCSEDQASRHFEKAETLLSNGDYVEALSKYNYVVNNFRESPYAPSSQYRIAFILYRHMNDTKAAMDAYYLLFNVYPGSPEVPRAREDMAEIYSRMGEHTKALGEYELLLKHQPADWAKFKRLIALEYLRMNDLRQARVELNELISAVWDKTIASEAYLNLAETYYIEGDVKKALSIYDKVISEYPKEKNSISAKFSKAKALEEMGNLEEALALYKEVLESYPNKAAVNMRIEAVEKRLKETPPGLVERR